jgi:hypothetical protein
MKQRKSTRETKNMIQTALWLPRAVHKELKEAGGERGLGEEIRRRLEKSIIASWRDDKTTQLLLTVIQQIARNLALDHAWHANGFAFKVFNAAVNELVSNHQPSDDAKPETMVKLQAMYGPEEKPETIGRILARTAIVASGGELRKQKG